MIFLSTCTPQPGIGEITYDDGYETGKHAKEKGIAQWLNDTFGGNIRLLKESTEKGVKTADCVWLDKLWEYKTAVSINAADKRLQDGIKQIKDNPGGIVFDLLNELDIDALERQLSSRFLRNVYVNELDIIIRYKGELIKILRYKK